MNAVALGTQYSLNQVMETYFHMLTLVAMTLLTCLRTLSFAPVSLLPS